MGKAYCHNCLLAEAKGGNYKERRKATRGCKSPGCCNNRKERRSKIKGVVGAR